MLYPWEYWTGMTNIKTCSRKITEPKVLFYFWNFPSCYEAVAWQISFLMTSSVTYLAEESHHTQLHIHFLGNWSTLGLKDAVSSPHWDQQQCSLQGWWSFVATVPHLNFSLYPIFLSFLPQPQLVLILRTFSSKLPSCWWSYQCGLPS